MRRIHWRLVAPILALVAASPAAAQDYASAVAVGDGEIFVAEPSNEFAPGVVYVYRKSGNGWQEAARLTASDATDGDRFGRAIAFDGGRLLIGATTVNETRGLAYVFERSAAGTWREAARLTGDDAAEGEAYGRVVALRGDVAVVGAWGGNGARGAAYVFRRTDGGRWVQQGKLTDDGLEENTGFNMTVATDGNRVAMGFPRYERNRGVVHLYRFDDASAAWAREGELSLDNAEMNTQFGSALLVRGEHIVVGAPGQYGFGGAVVFRLDEDNGSWAEDGALRPFDSGRRQSFATALATSGEEVLIGAPGTDRAAGSVYAITMGDGTWSAARKLTSDEVESRDRLGGSLAATEDLAVAGVPGDDYGAGTAVVFERTGAGWTATAKLVGATATLASVTGGEVACEEGSASFFDCDAVDMVSFMSIADLGGGRGVRLNDIWGWTDPQTGREYALVGRIEGTAFVDVTDPANPRFLGDLPMTEGANAASWRDIKVYRDHAFIVADGAGQHGMQVFDLTQLRNVRNAPVRFSETAHYDNIASAHNIVINEETGFAFSVGGRSGGETCGGGLHMINIQDPTHPTFAGCFADPATGRGKTGYSHDAQCVSYRGPDGEHRGREICFGSNETALSIADVTDKEHPVALAMSSYPNVGYTHQGWLSEDHRHFYMNDELDELGGNVTNTRTLIWDVSDLDDPVLVKEYLSDNRSSDHNLYIRGNLMYQSNYVSGLRVFDISDAANPVPVGFFDTVPYGEDAPGFNGSWSNYPFFASGIVVVTSVREGLFIVRKKPQDIIP